MHTYKTETYNSLETALHFAVKGEEMLYYSCEKLYDSTKQEQSGEYEIMCEEWRNQKTLCEILAAQLWVLNPDFKDSRFYCADILNTYGVSSLKPFRERKEEGNLIVRFIE
jgi:hypothetical protein